MKHSRSIIAAPYGQSPSAYRMNFFPPSEGLIPVKGPQASTSDLQLQRLRNIDAVLQQALNAAKRKDWKHVLDLLDRAKDLSE